MVMKQKYIEAHMKVAETYAQLSSAKRLQVGAIVVKDNRVISIGYNGMPSGWTNECEYERTDDVGTSFVTKPEVLHAETNAIAKLARSNESGLDATMFITHAPCLNCAKLIYQAGISKVYYRNTYRDKLGIEFLEKGNIEVTQI
jgi:dCMP deaminase